MRALWTNEEERELERLTASGATIAECARLLGRTPKAIEGKRKRSGVVRAEDKRTPVDARTAKRIRTLLGKGARAHQIAAACGISHQRARYQIYLIRQAERELEQANKRAASARKLFQPDGAESYSDGLYYKRGRFGRLFYWSGEEWRLSTRQPREVHLGAREKHVSARAMPLSAREA
jgi:hypothetical protein